MLQKLRFERCFNVILLDDGTVSTAHESSDGVELIAAMEKRLIFRFLLVEKHISGYALPIINSKGLKHPHYLIELRNQLFSLLVSTECNYF